MNQEMEGLALLTIILNNTFTEFVFVNPLTLGSARFGGEGKEVVREVGGGGGGRIEDTGWEIIPPGYPIRFPLEATCHSCLVS